MSEEWLLNMDMIQTESCYGRTTVSNVPQEIYFNRRHFGYLYANSDASLNHVVYSSVDWLGTELARFDAGQNIVTKLTYLPFGDGLSVFRGSDNDPIHFTGKERDIESGLDYFGARYYGSSMGRFLSPDWTEDPSAIPYGDTSNPQSFNLYSYAGNNPVANSDDDGHDCIYNNGDGTGYVLRGDCASDTDSGIYVNGTVDVNSFQYNASNNSSTFTYTPDSGANIGVGTIQGPNLNGGFDPGSLGAAVFGAQIAGQSGRGASRIVTGANGEAYYRADHYTTFTRIR